MIVSLLAPSPAGAADVGDDPAVDFGACLRSGASLAECLKGGEVRDPSGPVEEQPGEQEPQDPKQVPDDLVLEEGAPAQEEQLAEEEEIGVQGLASSSPNVRDVARLPESPGVAAAGAAPQALNEEGPITFDEFPIGTSIDTQYQVKGVHFAGEEPFITTDGANPTSPVLSGTPRFHGRLEVKVVNPSTASDSTARRVQFDVGYIDSPDSVEIVYYSRSGSRLGSARAGGIGINRIELHHAIGIHRITIDAVENEPAGFAIDNLNLGEPEPGSCKAVAFVGVRGSGESVLEDDGFGRFVNEARETFVTRMADRYSVRSVFLDYPAAPVPTLAQLAAGADDFIESIDRGVANLVQTLQTLQRLCPNQLFVLAGYSQGALVVHEALLQSVGSLSALNQVVAVELLSDPALVEDSPTLPGLRTEFNNGPGVAILAGVTPALDVPDQVIDATQSYCAFADLVCDPQDGILFGTLGKHVHSNGYWRSAIAAGNHAAALALDALQPD